MLEFISAVGDSIEGIDGSALNVFGIETGMTGSGASGICSAGDKTGWTGGICGTGTAGLIAGADELSCLMVRAGFRR